MRGIGRPLAMVSPGVGLPVRGEGQDPGDHEGDPGAPPAVADDETDGRARRRQHQHEARDEHNGAPLVRGDLFVHRVELRDQN
jgi:hypothetical protein